MTVYNNDYVQTDQVVCISDVAYQLELKKAGSGAPAHTAGGAWLVC